MNRYKISFWDLKEISDSLRRNDDELFLDYLNSFKGWNVFEKFKNILIAWMNDVDYSLNFNIDGKLVKVQLSYLLSELETNYSVESLITRDGVSVFFRIPEKFSFNKEIIPIYNMVSKVTCEQMPQFEVECDKLSQTDRKTIVDNLPAGMYNDILNFVIKNKHCIIKFSNPFLKDFKLNLMTNDCFLFLKGMFSNYDELYFQDVIFQLSKRLSGDLLQKSTPLEIKYYVEQLAKEVQHQNDHLKI